MAHVQFLQLVLVGLISATILTGAVTGALFVHALASDSTQYADLQPQSGGVEPLQ